MLKYLRIAVTTFSLTACVLLIALWVHSAQRRVELIPVLITAVIAAIPWIPWSNRFSLRTLLITTTLVAVVMGIIALAK